MKAGYIISIVLYICVAFWNFFVIDYVWLDSRKRYFDSIMLYLIIASVLIGVVYYILFKVVFPIGYRKQNKLAKFLLPCMFMILSFVLNRQVLMSYNCLFGKHEKFTIKGVVWDKYIERGSKGYKSYYLLLHEPGTEKIIKIKVSKNAWTILPGKQENFEKEFTIGSLGIIYRNGK